jgi:next-to-BRCA1 protein 1
MFFLIRYVLCTLCSLARQLHDVEGNIVRSCYLFHLLSNSYCCNTNTATNQLRFLLAIPPNQTVIFERFSDSAGAYNTLDSNNPSVYKQLYRAAKAKLKLRIKATLVDDHAAVDPTTTGAAQETSTAADCLNPQRYDPAADADRIIIASQPAERTEQTNQEVTSNGAIPTVQATESLQRQAYDLYLNSVMQSSSIRAGLEKHLGIEPRASVAAQVKSDEPAPIKKEYDEVAPGSSASSARESLRERFFADIAGISAHLPMHMRNVDQSLNIHGSYSVFCNECDHAIPGAHYHCSICDDGDFDLCQSCVDSGVLCGGEGHWLIKRIVKDGKVINSTTETIAPKATKVEDEKKSSSSPSSEVKVDEGLDVETRTCNSCVGGE